jgi:hypothetical protein
MEVYAGGGRMKLSLGCKNSCRTCAHFYLSGACKENQGDLSWEVAPKEKVLRFLENLKTLAQTEDEFQAFFYNLDAHNLEKEIENIYKE